MKKLFNNDWIRSISVLLILAVFLGGLLAVLSDVLYVAPEERAERAIKKIYGSTMPYQIELDIDVNADSKPIEYEMGKINKIYKIQTENQNGYDLLYQSVGFNGYKGGTITVWVQISVNAIGETTENYDIERVLLESYEKQTLMSKLSGDYYQNFCLDDVTTAYEKGELFTTSKEGVNSNPVSGATYSANAGINAVNCVIKHIGLTYLEEVQNG